MHVLRDHVTLVSRCRPHTSPPRAGRVVSAGTTYCRSRVLDALDADFGGTVHSYGSSIGDQINPRGQKKAVVKEEEETEDDSIEIIGPVKVGVALAKDKAQVASNAVRTRVGASVTMRKVDNPLHPIFANGHDPSSVKSKADVFGTSNEIGSVPTIVHTTMKGAPSSRLPDPPVPAFDTAATSSSSNPTSTSTNTARQSATRTLPIYSYKSYKPEPTVVYTQCEEEVDDLIPTLKGPIGFDMEWRVFFRYKAVSECRTAVVQVSDERYILVIQIYGMSRFPQSLKRLIESKDIVKMGANILNDGKKLFRDYGITARNLVELGGLSRQADLDPDAFMTKYGKRSTREIISLAKLVARYCEKTLVKGKERIGNWEAPLNEAMVNYAANDAHCALMTYNKLMTMAKEKGLMLNPERYTCNVSDLETAETEDNMDIEIGLEAPEHKGQDSPQVQMAPRKGLHPGMRSQQWRAYRFWHEQDMPLDKMCRELSSNGRDAPLKTSTVISYVVGALQADTTLPFKMNKLRNLVQMEAGSWIRHKAWILSVSASTRCRTGQGMSLRVSEDKIGDIRAQEVQEGDPLGSCCAS